jgi:pimeloyl-ACP methyl ester carboxylesterase
MIHRRYKTRVLLRIGAAAAAAVTALTVAVAVPAGAHPTHTDVPAAGRSGAVTVQVFPTTTPGSLSPPTKPTVVLVHGAWADASSWDGVIDSLRNAGYPVVAPANPLVGLDQDSAAVSSFLHSIKGPIIVVGHSYGGAVITNAAAGNPNVKALVYIAAFAPDTGESIGQLLARPVAHPIPAVQLITYSVTNADGTTTTDAYIDPAHFRTTFAGDLSPRLAADMAATQRPVSLDAISQTTENAAWHTIPSWYLVAKQDHAIAPDLERFMAERLHADTVESNGSHSVMVSHPAAVTRLIEQADRGTR